VTLLHLLTFDVAGRPASYSSAHEAAWKLAVDRAIEEAQWDHAIDPTETRFAVRVDFRTPMARNANEFWDLDNLIKPTLDAMERVFGRRDWQGRRQPADDRVDRIEASKRTVAEDEGPGARITVWAIK